MGTNELLGVDPKAIGPAMEKLFSGNWKKGSVPPLWDGETSGRIVERLLSLSNKI
jgi:UDP-N-acetylglucosamine 2-epimerase (non-hydrolysing)